MTLDGVTSFSRIKNVRNKYKSLYYGQNFGGISFHVMAENWQHLTGMLPFRRFYAPNFGEVEGAYWFGPVCPSVPLSIRP